MTHQITVDDQWFNLIQNCTKTVEGRLANPKFGIHEWKSGHQLIINRHAHEHVSGDVSLTRTIVDIKYFTTLREYLTVHITDALPDITNIDDGIKIYRRYIGDTSELKFGIYAITLK